MAIRHYYYNGQFKKAIKAFANIFAGLRVHAGLNACGEIDEISVPIRYGSTDRVAAAISARNTQNQPYTLPIMTCYMTGIELAPDRLHGVNMVDRRTYIEQGGIYPDDVKAIRRVMPVPFNLQMELAIHSSNTEQAYQILEQLLMLFDYDLQLQLNDAVFDWGKITKVTLTSIGNEEVYPTGTERRVLVWNLNFDFPIWISPPYEVRTEIVQSITLALSDLDNFVFEEIDENGNLTVFDPLITRTFTTAPPTVDPLVPPVKPYEAQHFDPTAEACHNDPSVQKINLIPRGS